MTNADDTELRYDQFVRQLLDVLKPVLPDDVSPELAFSGSMDSGRRPGPDMAILRGERTITFLATLACSADVVGVSPDEYEVERSIATDVPLVAHAAYARNIRRWEAGTLPRKRRARADFVVVGTCWLVGWVDGDDMDLECLMQAWERFRTTFGHVPADPTDRKEVAALLWQISSAAYTASLAAHREAAGS